MKRLSLLTVLMSMACPAFAQEIRCPGAYGGHLQGVAADANGNIYWSFTLALVKTDAQGKLLKKTTVPAHHGDLWTDGNTVYAAVNHPAPSGGPGARDSYICAYRTDDLSLLWKKAIPEVVHGAGGIAMRDGHFFVVSGRLLKSQDENDIYEYDADGVFIKRHVLESGHTHLGIQTMAYADDAWWFGCYGDPPETLRASEDLTFQQRFAYDCTLGIAPIPGGGFYIGRGDKNEERQHTGWVIKIDRLLP
ncbi:MAG TPA: hypothetical protein PLO37_11895 [Candidatus Hydrogenedentes bacterium]|nr:hypothetical protein [Candidatus Hydrogenedentota bacterium]HPG67544.1 hypothetical protein [Candidatus Hydrogenedentota bacterium]